MSLILQNVIVFLPYANVIREGNVRSRLDRRFVIYGRNLSGFMSDLNSCSPVVRVP